MEAENGEEALNQFFSQEEVDLVILDVMMPKCDGWEALGIIRQHSQVPVVMLTALGDERHEIIGLTKGADDYIAKPLSYEKFMARVKTHLRKVIREKEEEITIQSLKVNQKAQKVYLEDKEVELSTKEFRLLCYLLKNKNSVLSREQLLNAVWGYDFYGDQRSRYPY